MLVDDAGSDADYVHRGEDVTSEIVAPLIAEGHLLGVLVIGSTVEVSLTAADVRLAQTVAERLSASVLLGRKQRALADRARLFASLNEFARLANSIHDTTELHAALLGAISEVLPADGMALAVLDRATERFLVQATRGRFPAIRVGSAIREGDGTMGAALASRSLVLEQSERESPTSPGRRNRRRSSAAVPLVHDGQVLGVVAALRTSSAASFTPVETEVLTLLGAQAALALANAMLLEEVRELAIRDPLTGLYNRRHFDATLDHLLARHQRMAASTPVSAIMFDLDHFGRLNKEHGHQAGDAVLRAFAGILHERFRSADLVARYGGEEFVAILEGATLDDTRRLAEEVRSSLHGRVIQGPDESALRATVSAGCAALNSAEPTRQALLRAADVALFMAKRAGRNQVVAA